MLTKIALIMAAAALAKLVFAGYRSRIEMAGAPAPLAQVQHRKGPASKRAKGFPPLAPQESHSGQRRKRFKN